MRPSFKKFLVLSFVLFLVLGSLLSYLVYKELSDLENIKALVVQRLESKTKRKVEIGDAAISFSEGLSVNLKNVSIGSLGGGQPDFTAADVWVVINPIPLLNQQLEIQKVIVQGSVLKLSRDAEGNYNIYDLKELLLKSNTDPESWFRMPQIQVFDTLKISESQVHFQDQFNRPEGQPETFQLYNLGLSIERGLLSPHLDIKVSGEVPQSPEKGSFRFAGKVRNPWKMASWSLMSIDGEMNVENLDFAKYKSYLPNFKKFPILSTIPQDSRLTLTTEISGQVQKGIESKGKLRYAQVNPRPRGAVAQIPGRGTIQFDLFANNKRVHFKNISYRVGDFVFQANGQLAGFAGGNPRVDVTLQSNQFEPGISDRYPPLKIFPRKSHRMLQKAFVGGTVEINSLHFGGTLNQLKNITSNNNLSRLQGEITLRKVNWSKPLPPFKKATGSFKLNSGNAVVDLYESTYAGLPVKRLKGDIFNLTSPNPTLDWKVETPVEVGPFHQALPVILKNDMVGNLLDRYKNVAGDGYFILNVEGPLKRPKEIRYSGSLDIDKGSFEQDGLVKRVVNLKGSGTFDMPPAKKDKKGNYLQRPWYLKFGDMTGNFKESSFTKLRGDFSVVKGKPYLHYSGDFRLLPGDYSSALVSLFPMDKDLKSFIRQSSFTGGEVWMKYKAEGNPLDENSSKKQTDLSLKNVTVSLPKGYQTMTGLFGAINYKPGNLGMRNMKGLYGTSPVQWEGAVLKPVKGPVNYTIKAHSDSFAAQDIQNLGWVKSWDVKGFMNVDMNLKGMPGSHHFEKQVEFKNASYQIPGFLNKPLHESNQLFFRGHKKKGQPITVNEFEYVLGGNRFIGKAQMKSFDDPAYSLMLTSKDMRMETLNPYLKKPKKNMSGNLDLRLKAQGHGNQAGSIQYSALADLKRFRYQRAGMNRPVNLSGNLEFGKKHYKFKNLKVVSANSNVNVSGEFREGPQPYLNLDILGRTLDVQDFFPMQAKSEPQRMVAQSALLSRGTSKVELNLEQMNYKFWHLNNVSGSLTFKDKRLDIEKFNLYPVRDQGIRGQGSVSFANPKKLEFESYILTKRIGLNNLISPLGPAFKGALTGKGNYLEIVLRGGGANKEEIRKSLVGKVSFDFHSGTLDSFRLKQALGRLAGETKGPVMKKVGADADQVSPFERLQGDFTIRQGIAKTNNLLYATGSRRATMVGWFDLGRSQMDAVVGVAPMPGLDKILVKIPVVGPILTGGDEESLVKSYHTLRGNFSNPQISAIPLKSLERKLVGTFQGLLQTPQEILTLPSDLSKAGQ